MSRHKHYWNASTGRCTVCGLTSTAVAQRVMEENKTDLANVSQQTDIKAPSELVRHLNEGLAQLTEAMSSIRDILSWDEPDIEQLWNIACGAMKSANQLERELWKMRVKS